MSRVNLEDPLMFNPVFKTGVKHGVTILPNAAAAIDADMGPVIFMTPSASRILTLPAVTPDMKGLTFYFITGAAFTLVINNASAAAVATVPAVVGGTGMVVCLGDTTLGVGGWTGGVA